MSWLFTNEGPTLAAAGLLFFIASRAVGRASAAVPWLGVSGALLVLHAAPAVLPADAVPWSLLTVALAAAALFAGLGALTLADALHPPKVKLPPAFDAVRSGPVILIWPVLGVLLLGAATIYALGGLDTLFTEGLASLLCLAVLVPLMRRVPSGVWVLERRPAQVAGLRKQVIVARSRRSTSVTHKLIISLRDGGTASIRATNGAQLTELFEAARVLHPTATT